MSVPGKLKCSLCTKKMGPVQFTCTCEKIFCTTCRLPEVHKCPKPKKEETKVVENLSHAKKVENYNFI